ncbi:MAG: metallophosphoesterase [Bacteroidota bacterium]|nr:metallophosphoesterase [Bacteroidota bacterium]
MSGVFFIADPHFGHKNIIDYESRPFKSVEEMDNSLIKNWNNTVSKTDKIFILGDFAFTGKQRVQELVSQLNGIKTLILGNHDRAHSMTWWKDVNFYEISQYPIIYREWFILSHEPVYLNQNMPYANIFGHVHTHKNYVDYGKQGFCACVERIGYKPISWDEIMDKMKVI